MDLRKIVALGICLCMFAASPALALIATSAHDFSNETVGNDDWNPGAEICQPCHAPHGNITAADGAPLWNKTESGETFTPYTSTLFNGVKGLTATVAGTSKLCMSCHDGTTDLADFGGGTGPATMIGEIGATLALGADLTTDHPIGFDYPVANAELHGSADGFGSGLISDVLFDGKMECSTCHDVHDTDTVAATALLRVTNAGSAICMACHIK